MYIHTLCFIKPWLCDRHVHARAEKPINTRIVNNKPLVARVLNRAHLWYTLCLYYGRRGARWRYRAAIDFPDACGPFAQRFAGRLCRQYWSRWNRDARASQEPAVWAGRRLGWTREGSRYRRRVGVSPPCLLLLSELSCEDPDNERGERAKPRTSLSVIYVTAISMRRWTVLLHVSAGCAYEYQARLFHVNKRQTRTILAALCKLGSTVRDREK